MIRSSDAERTADWLSTKATIIACEQRVLGQENYSSEGYIAPRYLITFEYVVEGRTFQGTYQTNSLQELGHQFDILYDPQNPANNTGTDALHKRWARLIAAALGIILTLAAIWLWGKEARFQP